MSADLILIQIIAGRKCSVQNRITVVQSKRNLFSRILEASFWNGALPFFIYKTPRQPTISKEQQGAQCIAPPELPFTVYQPPSRWDETCASALAAFCSDPESRIPDKTESVRTRKPWFPDVLRATLAFPLFLEESSLVSGVCLLKSVAWESESLIREGQTPLAGLYLLNPNLALMGALEWHIDFIKENVLSRKCKGQPLSTFLNLKMPSTWLCREHKESDCLYIKQVDSECALLTWKAGSRKQKHLYCEWCCLLIPKPCFLDASFLFRNTPTPKVV